jgi:hypothetical protein
MNWSDFEAAERNILAGAPAAHWRRIEVRLRLARERLESGFNVADDVVALKRELGGALGEHVDDPSLDG